MRWPILPEKPTNEAAEFLEAGFTLDGIRYLRGLLLPCSAVFLLPEQRLENSVQVRPTRSCKYPRCSQYSNDGTGYCPDHVHLYVPFARFDDKRQSSTRRGYGRTWRKICERVLAEHGIPSDRWHLFDVDHNPPYDPTREPDHNKYLLVPRLHADHSRKTSRENGGWGKAKAR